MQSRQWFGVSREISRTRWLPRERRKFTCRYYVFHFCCRACYMCSHGNGLTFPVRTVDEDYDNLLGQRQRWAEEGEADEAAAGE